MNLCGLSHIFLSFLSSVPIFINYDYFFLLYLLIQFVCGGATRLVIIIADSDWW